jgi:CheY-like chemotaxis protein
MTKRIFVVDDEPSMIQLCTILLQREGFTVVDSALDGVEAVTKLKVLTDPLDMVLMDHRMPRKNGLETMSELLLMDPHLKVLFISADTSITSLALEGGAAGFLAKPFSVADFSNIVRSILHPTDSGVNTAS